MRELLEYIQDKEYFKTHQKVLIAVSGGHDSMGLLQFLITYQKELAITLGIVHVNHQQRPESDDEEEYLSAFARSKEIPFYVSYFSGNFSEEAARNFRYQFFKEIMAKHHYTALVTAHHADDQVETVFMRLIRGSRLRHLSGIKSVQQFGEGELIRPFLNLNKEDIPKTYYFEDGSNQDSRFFRNRVRQTYIPLLQSENPNLQSAFLELAEESRLMVEAVRELTADLDCQNLSIFQQQSRSVQYFLLQSYLDNNFATLQLRKSQFEQLLRHLNKSNFYHYHLKNGYYFLKTREYFEIYKKKPEIINILSVTLSYSQSVVFMGNEFLYTFPKTQENVNSIPLYDLSPITLRQRKPGDWIDFGQFRKKLRRLLIDEKIPSWERQRVIVGEQSGKIIFVLTEHKTYLSKIDENDIMKAKLYIKLNENR